jgi:diguanylate cyclase (GGDEF)-like protein
MNEPPPEDGQRTLVPTQAAQDKSLHALTRVADELSPERDEDELLRCALAAIVEELELAGGAALLFDEDGHERVVVEHGQPMNEPRALLEMAKMVVQWERAMVREFPQGGWSAAAPLGSGKERLGALALHAGPSVKPPDREVLRALGKQIGAGLVSARRYDELRAGAARADELHRINRTLSASLDLTTGIAEFARELGHALSFDRLMCGFVSDAGDYLEVVTHPAEAGWGLGSVVPVVGSGPGFVVLNERAVLVPNLVESHRFIEDMRLLEDGVRSYLLLPLHTRGRCGGVLGVARHGIDPFDDADLARLQPLASAVALALDNLRLLEKTKQLSISDEHTPLYNARFFHQTLERELKFVDRYQAQLALVFLDLDHFKPVNDRYGHLRGSRVLREVGFLIRAVVRETDYPARYGGDEFVVVLPQTEAAGAREMAERLRRTIEEHVYLQEEGINVKLGASVGVATYPGEATNKEALIRLADARMYEDKEARRARTP